MLQTTCGFRNNSTNLFILESNLKISKINQLQNTTENELWTILIINYVFWVTFQAKCQTFAAPCPLNVSVSAFFLFYVTVWIE